jgi:long-chain acyl-CoA synthetase
VLKTLNNKQAMNDLNTLFLRQSSQLFITAAEESYTFDEVYKKAQIVASKLKEFGLKPLERVAVRFWNEPNFIFAYFGVLLAGGVVVTISPLLTATEQNCIIEHSGARLCLSYEDQETQYQYTLASLLSCSPALKPNNNIVVEQVPSDLAALIYTSGTTGEPKGVMLTYNNIKAQVKAAAKALKLQSDDSLLCVLSLSHVFGQMDLLWTALDAGLSLHLLKHFEATLALELINKHKVSVLIAVPTMYQLLIRQLERQPKVFNSLRVCHSGAAPMPVHMAKKAEELFGVIFQEGYGLTETCSMAFSNPLSSDRKLGSVGQPVGGVELQLRSDEGDVIQEANKIGEVCIRGQIVSSGYFASSIKVQDQSGWLLTGDLGYCDPDGYLFLVDRKKDLIIRAGYKVYPHEVEEVLMQNKEVAQAVVVGINNDLQGQKVRAFILPQLKLTTPQQAQLTTELRSLCLQKLASYKRPSSYEFVAQFPKTFSGKILRRKLMG